MSIPTHTPETRADKKGDYWYVDRKGADYWYVDRKGGRRSTAARIIWTVLVISLTMFGANCCSSNMMAGDVNDQYTDAYGVGGTQRQASDIVGTLTTTVDTTVSSTVGTATDPTLTAAATVVVATVATEASETAIYLNATGDTLQDARVVLPSGDTLSFSLSGQTSSRISFSKKTAWNFVVASTSNGSKWYFDNAGLPLPNGYKPTLTVLAAAGGYSFSSSDTLSDVRLYYSNGSVGGTSLSGRTGKVTTLAGATVSYMTWTFKYDNSKWYIDRAGMPLPNGYKPTVTVAWKNQSLALTSSDLYDSVVVYYTDYTKDSYSTNTFSGTYKPFQNHTPDGFRVRLKSDGSKWYFDAAGVPLTPASSKWFSDMD